MAWSETSATREKPALKERETYTPKTMFILMFSGRYDVIDDLPTHGSMTAFTQSTS